MTNSPHAEEFRKRVVTNPNICPRCFGRVTTSEPRGLPRRHAERSWISDDCRDLTESGEFCYPPPKRGDGIKKELACRECGNVGDFVGFEPSDDGPIGRSRAIELGARVVERLSEQGIHPNEDAFFALIREAKSNEDVSSKDYDIFAQATAFGISRAVASAGESDPPSASAPASGDRAAGR